MGSLQYGFSFTVSATICRVAFFPSLCGLSAVAKFTRFCQWKNLELNIQLSMNDFSVHRIIGRGGFGEVYGCRKADTGKMYAMKVSPVPFCFH
jgi:hypothetical protein